MTTFKLLYLLYMNMVTLHLIIYIHLSLFSNIKRILLSNLNIHHYKITMCIMVSLKNNLDINSIFFRGKKCLGNIGCSIVQLCL